MSDPFTEKIGVAEVLVGDSVVGTGAYSVIIEQLAQNGAYETRARARGTLRLQEGHTAHKAMAAPAVRVRLDKEIEVIVEVHLYVPGASFVAFTCSDEKALAHLTRRAADE